jgi:hypothetical protein
MVKINWILYLFNVDCCKVNIGSNGDILFSNWCIGSQIIFTARYSLHIFVHMNYHVYKHVLRDHEEATKER